MVSAKRRASKGCVFPAPKYDAQTTTLLVGRDMNAATSQEVFAGPYLDDPVEKEKFSAAFMDMTLVRAFLSH
jgi:hypothetical protein